MKHKDSPFKNAIEEKELPCSPDGNFDWLRKTPVHDEWPINTERKDELPSLIQAASNSAKEQGISLPTEFIKFIESPELHERIRSSTADFLNVTERVLELPNLDGYLLRFLSDQQWCAHWYLYMNQDASDYCVVMAYEHFDVECDYEPDEIEAKDFIYFADSIESFFCRYWTEHEVFFHLNEKTELPFDRKFAEAFG